MSNIAIFGGTFNPLHIGHYEMLKAITKLDYIDKLLLMPDKIPPHKTCDFLASDTDRINMCRLVTNEFDKTELCLIEFNRPGKSYTIDTVKLLKKEYKNDDFYLVIGGDMLTSFDTWYKWEELIKLVKIIAFRRSDLTDFDLSVKRFADIGAQINVINVQIPSVSSTQLRKKINKKLLPDSVYNYIIEKGIYNV